MEINIEVPDLSTTLIPSIDALDKRVLHRATISDLYFEEYDEIEKGELFAELSSENGSCEIIAPASGILVSVPCEEGDSVGSEDVLATIDTQ